MSDEIFQLGTTLA